MSVEKKKALVVVNCFPPLIKNAGGVSKRYFTLCRALIDGLGWQVTLLTPVDIRKSHEPDIKRWLDEDNLIHLPARGVRITSATDGVAVFLDLFSFINTGFFINELSSVKYDCMFMDDVPWRVMGLLLCRAYGVPTVVSSHTDVTHMKSYKGVVKLVWWTHMKATHLASVHATVSNVFGKQMAKKYRIPFTGLWPPILWSNDFKEDISVWAGRAAEKRQDWMQKLKDQGCTPKYIMMFAGRWSAEKRIDLLYDVIPKDCALVIVGDGTSEFADDVANAGPAAGRPNVLPLRKMLNAKELRTSYAAADLFLSASAFETLGNTVIEAWCSGTPVAVQPAQGHLEFVKDEVNSWFVDYDKPDEALAKLTKITSLKLGAANIATTLPECIQMSNDLRTTNFAERFHENCIAPAIADGAKRKLRGCCCICELLKRIFAVLFFIILWIILRIFNRMVYILSSNPQMEVLGRLGGATEAPDKPKPPVEAKSDAEAPPPLTKDISQGDNYGYDEMFKNCPAKKYHPQLFKSKTQKLRRETAPGPDGLAEPFLIRKQSH